MKRLSKLIERVKFYWENRDREANLRKAVKLLKPLGMVPVRIEDVAGTSYIVGPDGARYRIGKPEKKK